MFLCEGLSWLKDFFFFFFCCCWFYSWYKPFVDSISLPLFLLCVPHFLLHYYHRVREGRGRWRETEKALNSSCSWSSKSQDHKQGWAGTGIRRGDGAAGVGCLQKERLDQESGGTLYVRQGDVRWYAVRTAGGRGVGRDGGSWFWRKKPEGVKGDAEWVREWRGLCALLMLVLTHSAVSGPLSSLFCVKKNLHSCTPPVCLLCVPTPVTLTTFLPPDVWVFSHTGQFSATPAPCPNPIWC